MFFSFIPPALVVAVCLSAVGNVVARSLGYKRPLLQRVLGSAATVIVISLFVVFVGACGGALNTVTSVAMMSPSPGPTSNGSGFDFFGAGIFLGIVSGLLCTLLPEEDCSDDRT